MNMTGEKLTLEAIEEFLESLRQKNRGKSSLDTYRRSLMGLYAWLPEDKLLEKDTGSRWRRWMLEKKGFSHMTVNTQVSIMNTYLRFIGHRDWQVEEFVREPAEQPELSREEYLRLLSAARRKGRERSYLLIKTMGGAGVRVQEMSQVTVEAVLSGTVELDSHNKQRLRTLHIPEALRGELMEYTRRYHIKSGPIFLTRDGRPLSRSTIHHYVSAISQDAQVDSEKANPRCLWKMYQSIQNGIRADVDALVRQTYERMVEKEQISIGWDENSQDPPKGPKDVKGMAEPEGRAQAPAG